MRLAADANVLLDEVMTASLIIEEVSEYVAVLARKKRLPLDVVHLASTVLAIRNAPPSTSSSVAGVAR